MNTQFNATDGWSSSPIGVLDRFAIYIEDFANFMASIAIFVLMCLGTTNIILRSPLFNQPIPGYIDLVELSMAGMAFLGAAYCQRLGAHIRMEILVAHLRGRWLWGFEIFGTLAALLIIGVLTWYGWGHFDRSYSLGDTTIDAEYPVWPSKLLVPIAFALWFVRLSIQLVGSIRMFSDPSLTPQGVAVIHDVATVAQEEIQETFGESIVHDSASNEQSRKADS